ncbi:hypothetical protein FS837_005548 [Tulasnella sp. UAMH 9824]|nr:hypothetical protein FS837_005548 [Tulasnella sp. UAMH 9824]
MPIDLLPSFVTPRLRELSLSVYGEDLLKLGDALWAINKIVEIKGLRLEKLKLVCLGHVPANLDMALANLIGPNKDSIRTLVLLDSFPRRSSIVNHSFQNLKALDFCIPWVDGPESIERMKAFVGGCPHVEYLRIHPELPERNLFDFPGLRAIFAWHLLSFEVLSLFGARLSKVDLREMSEAWPKLKKLDLLLATIRSNDSFPLTSLADIGVAFPELEDLSASFFYAPNDEPPLRSDQALSSCTRCPLSRLKKLRLGKLPLPERQDQQDSMARFLADVLPPGLRIERKPHGAELSNFDPLAKAKTAMTGRDADPKWDSVFQRVEELHGGVRIWVGMIPDDSGNVWF